MPSKVKHLFVSAKADGPDATLVRPSNWNADHDFGLDLVNRTGVSLQVGDVVALDPNNNESVVQADVVKNVRDYVVAKTITANLSSGTFAADGAVNTKVQGAVTRLNYLVKSATAFALEDSGVSSTSVSPPAGALGIALASNISGSAIIPVFWLGAKVPAGSTLVDLTNNTGVTLAVGDVVALDPSSSLAVVQDDTVDSLREFVVSQGTPGPGAKGPFRDAGVTAVKVAGAVTRLNWLRKSATARALEDTGLSYNTRRPQGAVALALESAAGAGVIQALFMRTEQANTAVAVLEAQHFS